MAVGKLNLFTERIHIADTSGLSNSAATDVELYTHSYMKAHTCSQKHKAAAFHQHESAFMFTAEQTEEGFTSCVYL